MERLVSCYVDKFARRVWDGKEFVPFVRNAIKKIILAQHLKDRDYASSVTFREFCRFLVSGDNEMPNPHWMPQSWVVPKAGFQNLILVDIKHVSVLLPKIVRELNPSLHIPSMDFANQRKSTFVAVTFQEAEPVAPVLADLLPRDIGSDLAVKANNFFDEELFRVMMELYAEDVVLYERAKASRIN